ncbi:Uncharacterized protein FWK35_00016193 [Aphis craccivora]|uniref:Uncharacterized protein n=1 Tax=Aphis craccivora TaxID=307492 RepID=A0A6G0YBB0_APHCR|nr:Uncharacterized protein FWK35_00016193 [Aphis craccivora]
MEVEKMLLILTDNLKTLNISKLDEKIIHYCNNTFSLDQTIFKELECTNIIPDDQFLGRPGNKNPTTKKDIKNLEQIMFLRLTRAEKRSQNENMFLPSRADLRL